MIKLFKKKWFKITFWSVLIPFLILVLFTCVNLFTQHILAHIDAPFTPDYAKIELTEQTDLKTIFLQTGIGENTAKKMIEEGRFDEIIEAQELFFRNDEISCSPMIKWFTREERLENIIVPLYDLQPGDILVSLSTHTFGWRHGHCGIVISENEVVESISMLYNSSVENVYYWQDYSNFAVLRVKDKTVEERQTVADFTLQELVDRKYSIFAGFGIKKAPEYDSKNFSIHCSYLAWYAWQNFGVDLDSDGSRLVTSHDILHSDKVEIVQLYGMDPREFLND